MQRAFFYSCKLYAFPLSLETVLLLCQPSSATPAAASRIQGISTLKTCGLNLKPEPASYVEPDGMYLFALVLCQATA
jgi:hypothetical protein